MRSDMSTKSRALFFHCNANSPPPEAFLKAACEKYKSWNGLAFIDGDEVVWSQDNGGPTPSGLLAIRNKDGIKDKDCFFAFGLEEDTSKPVAEDSDNLQPWVLVEEGEGDEAKAKVVVFVDGPLEHFATNTAPEGRPMLFLGSKLQPMIQSLWRMCGGDMDKFCEQMRMPHSIAAIESMLGEDGAAMIVVAADKGFMYYGSPKNGDEFPWGFANDTCGYKEGGAVTSKTRSNLKMSTSDITGNTAALKTEQTHQEVQYLFRPSANIIKKADLKALYIKYSGRQLSNSQMEQRQAAPLIPELLEEAKADSNITLSIVSGTSPAKVQGGATKVTEQVANVAEKGELKKFVDANVLIVMSPEEMEKNELPKPTFWDQSGWTLEQFINAKNLEAVLDKLLEGAKYAGAVKQLVQDLRYAIFQSEKDLAAATEPPKPAEPEKVAEPAPSSGTRKNRFAMSATG